MIYLCTNYYIINYYNISTYRSKLKKNALFSFSVLYINKQFIIILQFNWSARCSFYIEVSDSEDAAGQWILFCKFFCIHNFTSCNIQLIQIGTPKCNRCYLLYWHFQWVQYFTRIRIYTQYLVQVEGKINIFFNIYLSKVTINIFLDSW